MPSILGDNAIKRAAQGRTLAVSGKIRPGSKEITSANSKNPVMVDLFNKAKQGLMSFKEAEKAILDKTGEKYPFKPVNTPWFNVHASDVEGGQNTVNQIMSMYAEVREGDPEARLYRIPVMFPDLPTGVEGFFPSEYRVDVGAVKYFSEYSDDGIRNCMYLKPVDAVVQATKKKWLRRDAIVRKECDPSNCSEFGAGSCRFNGKLHFYIPNVTGSGVFAMRTGSTYAAEDVYVRLQELFSLCNGLLPKSDGHGNPVFFLTKVKKQLTYFERGVQKQSEPWLLAIESNVSASKVLLLEEHKRLQLASPSAAPMTTSAPPAWLAAADLNTGEIPSSMSNSFNAKLMEANTAAHELGLENQARSAREGQLERVPNKYLVQAAPAMQTETEKAPSSMTAIAAIAAILDLSEKHGLKIWDWAVAKFGTRFDDENPVMAFDEVNRMIESMGVKAAQPYLELLTLVYNNKLPLKELVGPYLKQRFGGSFKEVETTVKSLAHMKDLLSSGPSVARAHMESQVKKAA